MSVLVSLTSSLFLTFSSTNLATDSGSGAFTFIIKSHSPNNMCDSCTSSKSRNSSTMSSTPDSSSATNMYAYMKNHLASLLIILFEL